MIEKPKKERRFLKTLGRVGEILIQEVLLKVGSNLIKRIGGKKTLPSILILFLSISLFAQYPNTGNKQRLGFQTTADGLVWRGSISDTSTIQPVSNQNAWVILDTVNLKIYSFDFTSNVWNQLPSGTTIDTTSLSNRINLKLNIADTASMLTNYLRSGVAASTYLTQSNAASTYLPLAGGTLTGTIKRQDNNYDGSPNTFYFNLLNYFARRDNNQGQGQTAQITFTDRPGTFQFPNNVRTSDIHLMTAHNWNGSAYGQYLDTTLSVVANQDGGRIGISNLNPSYKLDVNGTLGVTGATTLTGGINGDTKFNNGNVAIRTNHSSNWNTSQYSIIELGNGNTYNTIWGSSNGDGGANSYGQNGIGNNIDAIKYYGNGAASYIVMSGGRMSYWTAPNGSAGATRTDTKRLEIDANTLTTFNATVLNEGSGDFDTRIESDGNANMVFVDASTDRVGIGTNTPSKTLDVNGEVKIATVTATPTSLLGKDASNVVGEVTTVAQTGLMTRGSTTATTGTPSAVFTVTHGLGFNPTSVIVTGTGASGAEKLIYEVYAKNSTTFSVQVWNYDGTEAASTSVTIYWLAIK